MQEASLSIALAYMRGLFDYLRKRGAPLGPVLHVLGITQDES